MTASKGTALITGASSGIGKVFARRLAAEGHDLILHGRRRELLEALAAELSAAHGVKAEVVTAELSDDAELDGLVEKVKGLTHLAMLVNNAGFGTAGLFHEESDKTQADMVRVHVLATVRLTHAALPGMIRAGRGAIINVSSIRAFAPGITAATYAGAKSFINLFTESIALELRGTGVRVQALCPGYTMTDFHQRIGLDTSGKNHGLVRWMTAERVVDGSLRGLERGQVICIPRFWDKLLITIPKLLPDFIVHKLAPGTGGKKTN